MWRDYQFKSVSWYCYCWKTSWIEYYLHYAQLASSNKTWARRWAPEHAHSSLYIFRDVMQVSTLSVQLGTGSEQLDWYRDATSVHYGHTLIDLSPLTDDRLHYCTNTGSISSNFYLPDRLGWINYNFWTMNTKNLWTLELFQSFSHKCKCNFLHSYPEKFNRLLCEFIVNLLQRNLQSIKKHHATKFQIKVR